MAIGRLVLPWLNAQLPLSKGRQRKLQKSFTVPGIHFTVGRAASPDREERQQLFECWGFIAVIMSLDDSGVDQAVTVRKSHYDAFRAVLDPGQAPPNPWKVVETNT